MSKRKLACLMAAVGFASPAAAQELVYEPVNPSFGGNPFNSSHLLAIANAQNDYERPSTASSSDDLDRFIRSLQGRLLSSLSSQVANAIFGEDAQDEGRIVFGDQVVEFVRTLDGIQLTVIDGDGTRTEILVPTLITQPIE
ncbi:curli production assembly/transport component CsgF [Parvularcula oceani]|uniref:curli production assembly/transport component CsgF n=1 Tax=Parvularcula oceani TaxID=1247963 RepID=UPI0009DFE95B|nr:curli production assembly/transport component CsgF [Parvularcula oceani]